MWTYNGSRKLASASENVRAQKVPPPSSVTSRFTPRPSTATRVNFLFVYLLLLPAFPSAPGSADEPYKWRGLERHRLVVHRLRSNLSVPKCRSFRAPPLSLLALFCVRILICLRWSDGLVAFLGVYELFGFLLFLADGHLINPFCCAPNHQAPISSQVLFEVPLHKICQVLRLLEFVQLQCFLCLLLICWNGLNEHRGYIDLKHFTLLFLLLFPFWWDLLASSDWESFHYNLNWYYLPSGVSSISIYNPNLSTTRYSLEIESVQN